MRRNCNLELRLVPFSDFEGDYERHGDRQPKSEEPSPSRSSQQQHQQLTIFYNGRVCVCDVTEVQARAILMLANREGELRTPTGASEPASPKLASPLCSPSTPGMSMKRSLQRFLQKRKHRMQATSPYNH